MHRMRCAVVGALMALGACAEPTVVVSGRLVDEGGQPLAGVKMEAEATYLWEAGAPEHFDLVTDQGGEWSLEVPRERRIYFHVGDSLEERSLTFWINTDDSSWEPPEAVRIPDVVVWDWRATIEAEGGRLQLTWELPPPERFAAEVDLWVTARNRRPDDDQIWPVGGRAFERRTELSVDPRVLGDLAQELHVIARIEEGSLDLPVGAHWGSPRLVVPGEVVGPPIGRDASCVRSAEDGEEPLVVSPDDQRCPLLDQDISTGAGEDCPRHSPAITIDLKEAEEVSSIAYLPLRGSFGILPITRLRLEVSDDGRTFEPLPVAEARFEPIVLDPPRTVSAVRVRALPGPEVEDCSLFLSEIVLY